MLITRNWPEPLNVECQKSKISFSRAVFIFCRILVIRPCILTDQSVVLTDKGTVNTLKDQVPAVVFVIFPSVVGISDFELLIDIPCHSPTESLISVVILELLAVVGPVVLSKAIPGVEGINQPGNRSGNLSTDFTPHGRIKVFHIHGRFYKKRLVSPVTFVVFTERHKIEAQVKVERIGNRESHQELIQIDLCILS